MESDRELAGGHQYVLSALLSQVRQPLPRVFLALLRGPRYTGICGSTKKGFLTSSRFLSPASLPYLDIVVYVGP